MSERQELAQAWEDGAQWMYTELTGDERPFQFVAGDNPFRTDAETRLARRQAIRALLTKGQGA